MLIIFNEKYQYYNNNLKYCIDWCYFKNFIPDRKICYEKNNINKNKIELNSEYIDIYQTLMKIINPKCVSLCDEINFNR